MRFTNYNNFGKVAGLENLSITRVGTRGKVEPLLGSLEGKRLGGQNDKDSSNGQGRLQWRWFL